MHDKRGLLLAGIAFGLYILGGIGTFAGLAMVLLFKGKNFLNWGEAHTVGYLFLCVGLCLSIFGVLLMRIFRNRKLF